MRQMTNDDAQWARRKVQQLLELVHRLMTTEAWLLRAEARHIAQVARGLRRD